MIVQRRSFKKSFKVSFNHKYRYTIVPVHYRLTKGDYGIKSCCQGVLHANSMIQYECYNEIFKKMYMKIIQFWRLVLLYL